jgi:DNA polymerase III delta prime subunit
MIETNKDEFLWVEKYRPHKISDCILPKEQGDIFQEFVNKGEIINMMLSGTSGVGKTTVARAMCEELECDYIVIAGSEETGIDMLRTKVRNFASSVSFSDKIKVVIFDEADYLNANSTQPALRGFIEEFSQNCRFIFTCNHKNRIIPAVHSRLKVVEFKLAKEDRPKMAGKFMKRLKEILELENVTYDEKVVAQLLTKFFPDYRKVLMELQGYSATGTIDEGILALIADVNIKPLIEALKEKDFKKMRTWVVNNMDNDSYTIFRTLYDNLTDKVKEVPQLVLLIADYSYKTAFCTDQEINLVACLTEIMATCNFKE